MSKRRQNSNNRKSVVATQVRSILKEKTSHATSSLDDVEVTYRQKDSVVTVRTKHTSKMDVKTAADAIKTRRKDNPHFRLPESMGDRRFRIMESWIPDTDDKNDTMLRVRVKEKSSRR